MSEPRLPPLQVLVVAYGPTQHLRRCLGMLENRFPVLVVDNSSSPATKHVALEYQARYVDAESNLGFAAGVNRGLAEMDLSGCDVLLLNPDATIDPSQVETLRRCLHAAEDVACAAPFQHRPGSPVGPQVRWPFPTPWRAWAEAVGLGRLRRVRDVENGYLVGSILAINGSALLAVGGFDEGFFLYGEEADWERRATLSGWRLRYCAEASAEHQGAATDADAGQRALRFHAGVERYLRKWHGSLGWRSYQTATVLTALRRAALSATGQRGEALRLAQLYAAGPYRRALRHGVVPERSYGAPDLRVARPPSSRAQSELDGQPGGALP